MRRISSLIVLLTLLFSLTAIVHQSRAYAAGCWGPSCDGFSPSAKGCEGDASSLGFGLLNTSVYGPNGRVDVMYSPACGATWARVSAYNPWSGPVEADACRSDGIECYVGYGSGDGSVVESPMTRHDGYRTKGCGSINYGSAYGCTTGYL